MRAVDLGVGAAWLAFWIYWLVAAVGVKAGRTRWRRFTGIRLVIVLVLLALARLRVFREHAAPHPWLAAVGLPLFALGLTLAIWARLHLGRNWGSPMSEKAEPELVMTGPYRWIRNPIYSGLILAMIGTALAVSISWLVVVALVGSYFVYSAFMEERFLSSRFPAEYPAYKRATKRLVPFLF